VGGGLNNKSFYGMGLQVGYPINFGGLKHHWPDFFFFFIFPSSLTILVILNTVQRIIRLKPEGYQKLHGLHITLKNAVYN